jgi:hypothetical protein
MWSQKTQQIKSRDFWIPLEHPFGWKGGSRNDPKNRPPKNHIKATQGGGVDYTAAEPGGPGGLEGGFIRRETEDKK